MNTENTVTKIRLLSSKAAVLTKVIFAAALAAGTLLAVSAVMMYGSINAGPPETAANGSVTVMSSAIAFSQSVKWLLCCGVLAAIMLSAGRMFTGISRDGSPFREETCRSLKKISVMLMIMALLPSAAGILIYLIFSPLPIMPGQLLNVQQLVFSVSEIFTAAVFYISARVFEYGCVLQTESDETL